MKTGTFCMHLCFYFHPVFFAQFKKIYILVVVHVTDSSTKHSFLASTPEPVTNHFIPRTSEEWNRLPAQLLWSRTTPATPGEKMLTSRLRGRI